MSRGRCVKASIPEPASRGTRVRRGSGRKEPGLGATGILRAAMAALSAPILAACIVEEEPTFLRTEYETVVDIIGFFGDASVLVERRVTQVDWYSGDMDEFARRKSVSSQAKLYDFVAGRYGDSMSVEPNSSLMVRGTSLYCRSGGSVQEYRFPTREAGPTRYRSDDMVSISADNALSVGCSSGVNTVRRLGTGRILHRDTASGDPMPGICVPARIVADPPRWIVFGNLAADLSHRIIGESGLESSKRLEDRMRGFLYVHGIGDVPYTYPEAPSAGLEAHFTPDDGSLAGAIATLLTRHAYPVRALNLQRGVYIGGDAHDTIRLRRLEDGGEIAIPGS